MKKGCSISEEVSGSALIADFARRVQRAAYAAGAEFVTVI